MPIDYAAYRAAASITCTSPSRSPRHPLPRRRPRVPGEPSSISVARATGPWLLGDARLGTVASQCTRLHPRAGEVGFVPEAETPRMARSRPGSSPHHRTSSSPRPSPGARTCSPRRLVLSQQKQGDRPAAADRQCWMRFLHGYTHERCLIIFIWKRFFFPETLQIGKKTFKLRLDFRHSVNHANQISDIPPSP